MKWEIRHTRMFISVMLFFFGLPLIFAQTKDEGKFLGKADLYKAKKNAFEFLSDSLVIRKFGFISDSIWNFAELALQ
jgi:hypothetical protein